MDESRCPPPQPNGDRWVQRPAAGTTAATVAHCSSARTTPSASSCTPADVGTGLNDRLRRDLLGRLSQLTCPDAQFDDLAMHSGGPVHWATPRVAVDVEYRQFTGRLRHPALKGLATVALWCDCPSSHNIPPRRIAQDDDDVGACRGWYLRHPLTCGLPACLTAIKSRSSHGPLHFLRPPTQCDRRQTVVPTVALALRLDLRAKWWIEFWSDVGDAPDWARAG
jgi:hypothetical protein